MKRHSLEKALSMTRKFQKSFPWWVKFRKGRTFTHAGFLPVLVETSHYIRSGVSPRRIKQMDSSWYHLVYALRKAKVPSQEFSTALREGNLTRLRNLARKLERAVAGFSFWD